MSDEGFYTNGFFRKLERERKKQEEAEKKAQEKAQEKTARELAKAENAQEKTAQQMWDEMPVPATDPNWDAPTHGNTILDELAGAVEGYAASGGELPAFICIDENGRFWLTQVDVVAEAALNQFKVTAEPDDEEPKINVHMNGGTAQAMFGVATLVASADFSENIPSGQRMFLSLVYRVMQSGSYVHAFDAQIQKTIGTSPPTNTAETCYFSVAVVESDGTVLQGHLGSVYLARPQNIVDIED